MSLLMTKGPQHTKAIESNLFKFELSQCCDSDYTGNQTRSLTQSVSSILTVAYLELRSTYSKWMGSEWDVVAILEAKHFETSWKDWTVFSHIFHLASATVVQMSMNFLCMILFSGARVSFIHFGACPDFTVSHYSTSTMFKLLRRPEGHTVQFYHFS